MTDVREKVLGIVTEVACMGWNDSTMNPNDQLIDEATDEILALLPLGVEVRGLTSDERQRLADLRATDFAPGSDQAFLLSLLDRPALPEEPSEEAVEAAAIAFDGPKGTRMVNALRAAYAAETGVTSRSSGNREGGA